jgi:hypothetical protein
VYGLRGSAPHIFMAKKIITVNESNGRFFVRLNGSIIAGFFKQQHAELFKSMLDKDAFYFNGETRQKIFNYFSNNHDFSLLDSDFQEMQIIISQNNYE